MEMQGKLARLKASSLRLDVVLLLLFCVMVLAFSFANPRFFSARTMANILQDFSPVGLRLGRVVADAPSSAFTPDSLLKAITGLGQPEGK